MHAMGLRYTVNLTVYQSVNLTVYQSCWFSPIPLCADLLCYLSPTWMELFSQQVYIDESTVKCRP